MKLSPTMIAALECIKTYMVASDNVRKYRRTSCGGHETRTVDALVRKQLVERIHMGHGRISNIMLTRLGMEMLEHIQVRRHEGKTG